MRAGEPVVDGSSILARALTYVDLRTLLLPDRACARASSSLRPDD